MPLKPLRHLRTKQAHLRGPCPLQWAVLSSVVLFGDVPNALAIARMALIMVAGLLVIHFDGQQRPVPAA